MLVSGVRMGSDIVCGETQLVTQVLLLQVLFKCGHNVTLHRHVDDTRHLRKQKENIEWNIL